MIIYDNNKAKILKIEREIDIEEIVELIIERKYIEILGHPMREGQQVFIISYNNYTHVVPFVIDKDENIIIKTVFPSRKFHKIYKERIK